jgi:hypothetical protein
VALKEGRCAKKALAGKFDKNSLWGELNIQKGALWVKGFLLQHLGVVWGLFQQAFGGI